MSSVQPALGQQVTAPKRHVADVMTTAVVTAYLDAPLKEIAAAMARNRISTVPVIGPTRDVMGVVSASDLLKHVASKHDRRIRRPHVLRPRAGRVADAATAQTLMTWPAVTLTPEMSIADAARIVKARHLHFFPVVRGAALVGCVTAGDLDKVYLRSDDAIRDEVENRVVRELMLLEAAAFGIDVREGVVAVAGMLDRRSEGLELVECIEAVPGVVGVRTHFTFREDTREA